MFFFRDRSTFILRRRKTEKLKSKAELGVWILVSETDHLEEEGEEKFCIRSNQIRSTLVSRKTSVQKEKRRKWKGVKKIFTIVYT